MEKIYLDVPFLGPLEGTLEWKKKICFSAKPTCLPFPGITLQYRNSFGFLALARAVSGSMTSTEVELRLCNALIHVHEMVENKPHSSLTSQPVEHQIPHRTAMEKQS